MRRLVILVILPALLATSGCTLPEAVYNLGGSKYYSAGGTDDGSRDAHFNAELSRWKQYDP